MDTLIERPPPRFDWFIPIDGDGTYIGTTRAERPPTFQYLREVAETAEHCGFHSVLIPTRFANGLFEESAPLAETWTTVSALAVITKSIRFLVAVRPGFVSTGLFAQMAAMLDHISGGRLDINIVPGGIQGDFERFGQAAEHDSRYDIATEFIQACRKLWAAPEPVYFNGNHVQLNGAMCSIKPIGQGPSFYLGGASDNALSLAAKHSDVYLMWIQSVEQISQLLERVRTQFKSQDRKAMFGLRTHIIIREQETEAWAAAYEMISQSDSVVKKQRKKSFSGTPMVGQRAQNSFMDDRPEPRLWNGISSVRVNCGTAIVGTPGQVAEELLRYWNLGVDEFILSGFPHIEECHRVASQLLPLVKSLINNRS